jgi:hypothetical protein
MRAIFLASAILIEGLTLFAVSGCKTTGDVLKRTPHSLPAGAPDSVVYRPYRLLLDQLAEADRHDRQALFKIFRLRGFTSPAADSGNRWLMRNDSTRLQAFQLAEQRYGWPRVSRVGQEAVQEAYLLVQHAPAAVHASYQDTLARSHAQGELSSFNYATYLDRVLHYQGRPQRYGTQSGKRVLADGREEDYLFPVEDLPQLDRRRATMQLDPILPRLQPGTLILKPNKK